MNHEYRIKEIVLFSAIADPEDIKDLLEDVENYDNLPFDLLTGDDWEFFEDWLKEQYEKGFGGFLFKAASPLIVKRKDSEHYSWGYYTEKLMHANSFEEAKQKAQEFANNVYKGKY